MITAGMIVIKMLIIPSVADYDDDGDGRDDAKVRAVFSDADNDTNDDADDTDIQSRSLESLRLWVPGKAPQLR